MTDYKGHHFHLPGITATGIINDHLELQNINLTKYKLMLREGFHKDHGYLVENLVDTQIPYEEAANRGITLANNKQIVLYGAAKPFEPRLRQVLWHPEGWEPVFEEEGEISHPLTLDFIDKEFFGER
jgi:hypothetical protein